MTFNPGDKVLHRFNRDLGPGEVVAVERGRMRVHFPRRNETIEFSVRDHAFTALVIPPGADPSRWHETFHEDMVERLARLETDRLSAWENRLESLRLLRIREAKGLGSFLGGRIEMTIMRCTDMLMAFPTLLLALLIVAALGGSLVNEIVAIGIALTPNFTRLARSLALTIRANDYIMAARALGCTPVRIMLRHILPNAVSTLVVIDTLDIAAAIRTEAGLSFLGLGVPPPTPSWGNILSEGRQYIQCCTWLTTYSGLAIMLAVLAFNLMGDALRDLLDPRLRGE